jgi:hypothetical protein
MIRSALEVKELAAKCSRRDGHAAEMLLLIERSIEKAWAYGDKKVRIDVYKYNGELEGVTDDIMKFLVHDKGYEVEEIRIDNSNNYRRVEYYWDIKW